MASATESSRGGGGGGGVGGASLLPSVYVCMFM